MTDNRQPTTEKSRDTKSRKKLGNMGERLAANKLTSLGYRVVETNWRCEYGELDIIAWHKDCLVFIEVRTRRGDNAGLPEESIGPRKLATLTRLAEAYLNTHLELWKANMEPPESRLDVAAVQFSSKGLLTRLDILENITE